jgi:hypothetical protein
VLLVLYAYFSTKMKCIPAFRHKKAAALTGTAASSLEPSFDLLGAALAPNHASGLLLFYLAIPSRQIIKLYK